MTQKPDKMFSYKVNLVIVGVFVAFSLILPIADAGIRGGITQLTGESLDKAEEVLNKSLSHLAAGDGPAYKIKKVNSVTSQIVSGRLLKYDVDLETFDGDIKQCNVQIWSQPWKEDGVEVTFNCPGEELLVFKHSAL